MCFVANLLWNQTASRRFSSEVEKKYAQWPTRKKILFYYIVCEAKLFLTTSVPKIECEIDDFFMIKCSIFFSVFGFVLFYWPFHFHNENRNELQKWFFFLQEKIVYSIREVNCDGVLNFTSWHLNWLASKFDSFRFDWVANYT